MQYEWDDKKNVRNMEKHGVDFEFIVHAEWEKAYILPDTRKEYGESRLLAYVPIHARLYAAVYAKRGNKRRIISLRKANQRERKFYEKAQT